MTFLRIFTPLKEIGDEGKGGEGLSMTFLTLE